ncbi:uncharacterized protein J3R85_007210 [Psidium guajava]|nr:uncharacterized protein J3R85_007210 [Psidium guajava]
MLEREIVIWSSSASADSDTSCAHLADRGMILLPHLTSFPRARRQCDQCHSHTLRSLAFCAVSLSSGEDEDSL